MRFRWPSNLNLSLTLVDVKLVLLGSGDYWQAPGQVPVDYESSRLLEMVNDKGWLIWSSVWQFKWKDYQCTQIAINSFNASPKPLIFTWCEKISLQFVCKTQFIRYRVDLLEWLNQAHWNQHFDFVLELTVMFIVQRQVNIFLIFL